MANKIHSISELPNAPAVYVMYGGSGASLYVAYVGVALRLKNRIRQHLVKRDSSVATGTSAVALNPDFVTELKWWEHPDFSERYILEAAELVAFDVFEPSLRSRGRVNKQSEQLYEEDIFRDKMRKLFSSEQSGHLVILTLQDALDKIEKLESRLEALEKKVTEKDND